MEAEIVSDHHAKRDRDEVQPKARRSSAAADTTRQGVPFVDNFFVVAGTGAEASGGLEAATGYP